MAKGSRGGKRAGGASIMSYKPKVGEEVFVDEWFRDKISMPSGFMHPHDGTIIGETEKAYKIGTMVETLDGERERYFEKWVPKSTVKTKKQRDFLTKKREKNYETGRAKYDKMIKFAKENNIKGVRVGLRKETVLKKIEEAGLKYKW